MPHRNRIPSSEPIRADANGSDPLLRNDDDGLTGVLNEVVNHLFAAGLDVHMALQLVDGSAEPARWMHSAVARLDTAVTTILRAGLARVANAPDLERALIDPIDVPIAGLAGRPRTTAGSIAHAEGIVAERHHVPIAEAVTALIAYARGHDQLLPDVARAVIDGSVDLSDFLVRARRNADGGRPR
jgi:hypothetical protein